MEKIIEACPEIIKKTKMDDMEPIFYAVRYANFKVFKIILKNSVNYKYDVRMFLAIRKINCSTISYYTVTIRYLNTTLTSSILT